MLRRLCFFLSSYRGLNEEFPGLFDSEPDDTDGGGGSYRKDFTLNFGWIYSATLVAEMERVSLGEVWELPTVQFLNDLLYIKKRRELDRELEREALRKSRGNG